MAYDYKLLTLRHNGAVWQFTAEGENGDKVQGGVDGRVDEDHARLLAGHAVVQELALNEHARIAAEAHARLEERGEV